MKYPKALDTGENSELNDLISLKDSRKAPEYDFLKNLYKEKDKKLFRLKEWGENYNSEIMQFINFVLDTLREKYDKKNAETIGKELRKQGFNVKKANELDEDQLSLEKLFDNDIRALYELVKFSENIKQI